MQSDKTIQGVIFNVQHYSIHDGPGIRTTVFIKGCPLRCKWCQNPESQNYQPELLFYQEKCTGCGTCIPFCAAGAISNNEEGVTVTNRQICQGCCKCTEICPNEARTQVGRRVTAGEVFEKVLADKIFYDRSCGGVTLSGGEPLAQPQFSAALLSLSKEAGINTVLETSGYAKWETVRQVMVNVDLIYYDFKHMDSQTHLKLTGVPNELILENVKRIYHELKIPVVARVPIIPGENDSESNLTLTAEFIAKELSDSIKVHLLPYHRLGESKVERLERSGRSFTTVVPTEEYLLTLQKIFECYNLQSQIGG